MGTQTVEPAAQANGIRIAAPAPRGVPTCQACGGAMRKAKISSGNFVGIMLGLFLLVAGLVITLLIPLIGWVLGPIMMILALGMGGKRQKVWRCENCRSFVPRM